MLRLIQRWPAWRSRAPDATPAGRSVSGNLQALASRIAGACGAPTSRLRGLAAAGLVLLAALAGLAAPAAAQTTTTEVEIWSATATVVDTRLYPDPIPEDYEHTPSLNIDIGNLNPKVFFYGGKRFEIIDIEPHGVYWDAYLNPGSRTFVLYVDSQRNVIGVDPVADPLMFISESTDADLVNGIINAQGFNYGGSWTVVGQMVTFRLVEVIENPSANLSALSLRDPGGGAVALLPAFSASTTSYKAFAAHDDAYVTLWATGKSLSITPADADASAPGHQVRLSIGQTKTVTVAVTAGDGTTMKSYTVAVTRPETDVCERTPAVRDAIVAAVSGVTHCGRLIPAQLRGINPEYGLDITSPGFRLGDFAGLSGLGSLVLTPTDSTTLPAGLFEGCR